MARHPEKLQMEKQNLPFFGASLWPVLKGFKAFGFNGIRLTAAPSATDTLSVAHREAMDRQGSVTS
jgi:hypothetical protein